MFGRHVTALRFVCLRHAFPSIPPHSAECLTQYLTDHSYRDGGLGLRGWRIYRRSGWLAGHRKTLNPNWAYWAHWAYTGWTEFLVLSYSERRTKTSLFLGERADFP
ncbi:hypothetical protein CesoFtcFv8_005902 [Champsocephalus esox]|uniref:Uncharacterized protein n=1 Tax=Champsocephalus esox TaxID=159716 RepID=A0AAN8H6B5_9TELE|nr:hypothetical protein CesoFtcFv8_005902 [Champsocephalus esox]